MLEEWADQFNPPSYRVIDPPRRVIIDLGQLIAAPEGFAGSQPLRVRNGGLSLTGTTPGLLHAWARTSSGGWIAFVTCVVDDGQRARPDLDAAVVFAARGVVTGGRVTAVAATRTKGKRARSIPLIAKIRPMILRRIEAARERVAIDPTLRDASEDVRRVALLDARLFVGPRGGRIATAVLRNATHWDEVVARLGHQHLRRHDLRHTGLTWFADAGVPLHRLQRIAGHTDPRITQRYLHPDIQALQNDGELLARFLVTPNGGPQIPELLARQGQDFTGDGLNGPKLVPRLRMVE